MKHETGNFSQLNDSISSNHLSKLFNLLDEQKDHETVGLHSPEAIFQDYMDSPLLDWLQDQEICRDFLNALANHSDQVYTLGDALSHPLPDNAWYKEIMRAAKSKLKGDQLSPEGIDAVMTLYLLVKATEYQVNPVRGKRKASSNAVKGWEWIRSDVYWLPEAYKITIATVLMEEKGRRGSVD